MNARAPETDDRVARTLALASTAVVLAAVLSVFYGLTAEFGGTPWLVTYVALAGLAGTLAARQAPTRLAVGVAAALLTVGVVGYLVLLPPQYYDLFGPRAVVEDLAAWLTGRSVRLMLEADLWAVSVAPAPVFLVSYLALRGRYDATALAGGASLGFFVLSGDLGTTATLAGTAGVLGVVGFGAVATADAGWQQLQEVGLVVGLALLLTRFVRVVPATGGGGLAAGGGGGGGGTLERELLGEDDRMLVGSRPSMSPTPRFSVTADERAYWHVRSFDHYDGQGWRRTDRATEADRPLAAPPSGGTALHQSVEVRSTTRAMPAAWKPVRLGASARDVAVVSSTGNLEPSDELEAGAVYDVVSEVPEWTREELAAADGEYPAAVVERYTQLPGDLPDRLVRKAGEITADASGPYETALAVQEWLEREKSYTLSVTRQDWDVADAFVFALDAGYCVYFATAMAVMLRTQGVPARFTVGYGPGEPDGDGRWLVRGLHAHAWVEVYFPSVGWVTFDPTPAGPRQRAQQEELQGGTTTPDDDTPTPSPTPTPTPTPTADGTETNATADGTAREPGARPDRLGGTPEGTPTAPTGFLAAGRAQTTTTPPGEEADGGARDRLWVVGAVATLVFGSVRLGYAQSALRSVWLRWQPRTDDPDADVERALARMEYHLESRFRPRGEGEARRRYLASLRDDEVLPLDHRAWRVLDAYQESRYGDGVDRATADEVVDVVDEMVRD